MEAREGKVFDILVVADCGGLVLGGLGCARQGDLRFETRTAGGRIAPEAI